MVRERLICSPRNLSLFLLDMRCDLPLHPVVLPHDSSLQTMAHTLGFSFALLALYSDKRRRFHQHIKGVMSTPNGKPVDSRKPKCLHPCRPPCSRAHGPNKGDYIIWSNSAPSSPGYPTGSHLVSIAESTLPPPSHPVPSDGRLPPASARAS